MRLTQDIVELAIEKACSEISGHLDARFTYHDLSHTVAVVEASIAMAKKTGISKQNKMLLTIAAWFHDTGYTRQIEGHEQYGAELASGFLKQYNIDEDEIAIVRNCILATKYPQQPLTELEKIICDADMSHLAAKGFRASSDRLREEWRLTKDAEYTDRDWLLLNIDFLANHKYQTEYAREEFERKKQKNILALKNELEALELERKGKGNGNGKGKENGDREAKVKGKEKDGNGRMERGVETMFKTASGNHMRLSGMADNKAHILLSINSIIISVILSVLSKELAKASYLFIPTVLLLCVSVITIVFAVLATKPKVSKGVFTKEQINNKEVNLLFFGNFHQMELELFEWGIEEVIYDKDYLYRTMTRDIYYLGKVLAVKYRYLNIGYRVFMYGLIGSVLAFAASYFLVINH